MTIVVVIGAGDPGITPSKRVDGRAAFVRVAIRPMGFRWLDFRARGGRGGR